MNYSKYKHITKTNGIVGGRFRVAGTRLEPAHVIQMSEKEALEDHGISKEVFDECHKFISDSINSLLKTLKVDE